MDESRQPQEFFAAEYAPMSEKELTKLSYEYDDLIEPAQAALRDELKKRGMELPRPEPKPEPIHVPAPSLYGTKSNRQLLQIAGDYDALPEASQAALREEFASRGLEPPLVDDEAENSDSYASGDTSDHILDPNSSEFVTIARYRDMPEAVVARSVLESAGIQCMLRDENTIRMDWLWSNLIGGMRLQVQEKDAETARELLAQPIPARFQVDHGHVFEQPACPKCGSHDVVTDDRDRKIKATSMLVLGVPVPASARKNGWKCNTCGTKWIDDEKPPTALAEGEGPVVVGIYENPVEGSLARAVLAQAGIQCFLYDENMYDVEGYSATLPVANLLGGLRLVVSAADAEQAKALLSQSGHDRGAPLR